MVAVEPLQGIHRKRSLRKEGFFLLIERETCCMNCF